MGQPVQPRKIPWHLILIFSLLSLGIVGTGYVHYEYQRAYFKQEKVKELTAIANLKIKQIVDWRKERLADSTLMMDDSFFASRVKDWLEGRGKSGLKHEILYRLNGLMVYHYQNIILLDSEGRVRLSVKEEARPLTSPTLELARKAMRTRKVIFSDLYIIKDSQAICLSIITPILFPQGTKKVPVGALLIRINPYEFLYPLIQSWPTPSRSGETVLLRREGKETLVLNELRNRKGTAFTLRYTLKQSNLPAAMAVRGRQGAVEGVDYRGVPVVAVIGSIPDSAWYFVAKIDTAEIYAPLRALSQMTLLLLIFFIAVSGVSLAFIWSNQQMRFFRRQYEMERDREKALQKLNQELQQNALLVQDLYNNAPCGYHSLDPEGIFVQINDTELTWLGYSPDELLGKMRFSDLLTEGSRGTFEKNFSEFKERGSVRDLEYDLIRKDGTVLPVLLNATLIRDKAGNYLMSRSTVFDITERQQAERALKESEERLRFLAVQLLGVQEQERKRVSMELHDDLGQSLLVLKMQLNAVIRQFSPEPPIREDLKKAAGYIDEVIDKVRRLSHALSPTNLENLGLVKAIKSLLEEFQRYHDIAIEADLDEVDHLLWPEVDIGIYRILQEFLTNVHKHAEATKVKVTIKVLSEKVAITMEDNGKGFVLEEVQSQRRERGALGLISMEERVRMFGGRIALSSQKGQGTRIYFDLPVTAEKEVLENPAADG
jgi:PAS domain S-box-containing protein